MISVPENGMTAEVPQIPDCDMCVDGTRAEYDAKTSQGPWAYMCRNHYGQWGIGLGTGKGQRLILKEE